jgi:uncharacterized protein YggT (Ycf19 family)
MQDPKRTASGLTMIVAGVAETLLAVRVVFQLVDADATNSFVRWVYAMSEPMLEPIRNLIGSQSFDQRFVLDFRALVAMAFWAVLAYVVLALLEWAKKPRIERDAGWRRWLRNVI